jgi:hypothetical protein
MSTIALGLDTFGDVTVDASGHSLPHAHVLRHVVADLVAERALPRDPGSVRRPAGLFLLLPTNSWVGFCPFASGARVLLAGVAVGLAVAAASTRALRSLLFGVEALDPATFAAVAGRMVVVRLLAVYLPERSASWVDPIESLRGE